jgi:hypothetical protein
MAIPKEVLDRFSELDDLVRDYPRSIPVDAAAKLLGISGYCLRSCLMGYNPIGLGWKEEGKANRGFNIPTGKFYAWYHNLDVRKEA